MVFINKFKQLSEKLKYFVISSHCFHYYWNLVFLVHIYWIINMSVYIISLSIIHISSAREKEIGEHMFITKYKHIFILRVTDSIIILNFYILIMDEKVLVLCEKWLSKFSSNLYILRPPESEKTVFTKVSVCLSVCLSLYRSRKSKDKFVNQPHPIKIERLSTIFVFLKITFWQNQKFQYWFLIVLMNLYKLSW